MIKNAKRAIVSGLLPNSYLVPRTRNEEILELIGKLRPVDCGIELVRIGGRGDGGYLVPNDLDGIEYCFSPGVSNVSTFEDDLARRQIKSYLADYSVDGPAVARPELTFDKKYLGALDRGEYFRLDTWKRKYLKEYSGDLLLQMDIEGAEYEVIFSTPDELLNQFRILVIEFHGLEHLFGAFSFRLLSSCFERLLQFFYVVHLHPNNCCGSVKVGSIEIPSVMEFTLLNKRRVCDKPGPQRIFPHRLDADNVPGLPPLTLPKGWY